MAKLTAVKLKRSLDGGDLTDVRSYGDEMLTGAGKGLSVAQFTLLYCLQTDKFKMAEQVMKECNVSVENLINEGPKKGETIFSILVKEEKPQAVEWCFKKSPGLATSLENFRYPDDGQTVMTWVVSFRSDDLLPILLSNANNLLDIPNSNGKKPITLANNEYINIIESSRELSHEEIMEDIQKNDRLDNLIRIIEKDPGLLDFSYDGDTPLTLAIKDGGRKNTVALLIEKVPALLDKPDADGKTPLIIAIEEMQKSTVEELLNSGADITKADASGKAPLAYAGDKIKDPKKTEIRQLVLKKGKEIGLKQSDISIEQKFLNFNLTQWLSQKMEKENWSDEDKAVAKMSIEDIPIGACNGWSWMHRVSEAIGQEDKFYEDLKKIADWDGIYNEDDKDLNTLMDSTLQMLIYGQHTPKVYENLVDKLSNDENTKDALLHGRQQISVDIGNMLMPEGKGSLSVDHEEFSYQTYDKETLKEKLEDLIDNHGPGESVIIGFDGYWADNGKDKQGAHATDVKITRDAKGNIHFKMYNPNQSDSKSYTTTDFNDFYSTLNKGFGRGANMTDLPFRFKLNTFKYQQPKHTIENHETTKASSLEKSAGQTNISNDSRAGSTAAHASINDANESVVVYKRLLNELKSESTPDFSVKEQYSVSLMQ